MRILLSLLLAATIIYLSGHGVLLEAFHRVNQMGGVLHEAVQACK